MLTAFSLILFGCGAPVHMDLIRVEIIHETEDRFMDDLPRTVTVPPAGSYRLRYGENVRLHASAESGVRVSSWIIQDGFGNKIDEVSSPHNMLIRMNHVIIANLECDSDDVCIQGYKCINHKCQHK